MKKLLLVLLLAGACAPAIAQHAGHKPGEPGWADPFRGAKLAAVWQSAQAAAVKIESAAAAKTTDGIADWAETIHRASFALIDQLKISDKEKKKRIDGALDQAAGIADDILDAAQHADIDKISQSTKRLAAALKLASTRLPKEIVEAPPQELRFAKAGQHDNATHPH